MWPVLRADIILIQDGLLGLLFRLPLFIQDCLLFKPLLCMWFQLACFSHLFYQYRMVFF
jgi:hypothetical protein